MSEMDPRQFLATHWARALDAYERELADNSLGIGFMDEGERRLAESCVTAFLSALMEGETPALTVERRQRRSRDDAPYRERVRPGHDVRLVSAWVTEGPQT